MTALKPVEAFDVEAVMAEIGVGARVGATALAKTPTATKNAALNAAAAALRESSRSLLEANAADMEAAEADGLRGALLDRLALDEDRVEAMAVGLEEVAGLDDPVGRILMRTVRPNGLVIERVSVPIGVIAIIYESRPNVTADAGGLCLKSGNAAILRGGSESFNSSRAIMESLHKGLARAGLPETCIQLVPTRDRAAVGVMLAMDEVIDLIVPRGGRSLIERVKREGRIPVLAHLEGICHVYVHDKAKPEMARKVLFNAKMRRTGVCGAAETLVIDQSVAERHLSRILDPLFEAGCEVRGDEATQALDERAVPASDADWQTEYLDAIISVRVVDGLDLAIEHVNAHGSHHTDSIVTEDDAAAKRFLSEVDSAIVLHNASTQFADGGQFGMGAEIGISTDRLHARGPVGVEQLTTYKYKVLGKGQVRP